MDMLIFNNILTRLFAQPQKGELLPASGQRLTHQCQPPHPGNNVAVGHLATGLPPSPAPPPEALESQRPQALRVPAFVRHPLAPEVGCTPHPASPLGRLASENGRQEAGNRAGPPTLSTRTSGVTSSIAASSEVTSGIQESLLGSTTPLLGEMSAVANCLPHPPLAGSANR